MKPYDDNLLLYLNNLIEELYDFTFCILAPDLSFYEWDMKRRLSHIVSYKKRLLKDYEKFGGKK